MAPPLLSLLLLAGCAIKRGHYDVPAAPLPDQFKQAAVQPKPGEGTQTKLGGRPAGELRAEALLDQWWRFLGSEELNRLIDQALANNQDLRIAMLRISQAQARSEQAYAGQFPVITAPMQGHDDSPSNGINSATGFGTIRDRQYVQGGVRGDWRVDLWGELSALADSAEMQMWRATYQRDDTRRTLIANVASQYVQYLSLNDRIRVAHETEAALQNLLDAVSARLEMGDATIIELEQQRAAVLVVRATIPGLELQRETAANALALLLGVTPGALALSDSGIDSLSFPGVIADVPGTLLLRRPDVRAVEARLLSADADIDVARARVLPPLDLNAQSGWGILALGHLVTPYGAIYNLAATLTATIFDHGKRSQDVAFARAMHEELVETYMRVIYTAVRETEDALANTHRNGKRLEAQQLATEAALRAWQASQDSYGVGDIDFLTLLDTERTYHRNLDEFHRARMDRYQGLVSLFNALGGGVPQGGDLPGDGDRPKARTAASPAAAADSIAGIDWSEPVDDEEYWLVELAGLQDRDGVGHAWLDLKQRFPQLVADRVLLPRLQGRVDKDEQERATWYRLFVSRFADADKAAAFCRELNGKLVRCRVVSSSADEFSDALADKPPKAPAQPTAKEPPAVLQEAPLAAAVAAPQQPADPAPTDAGAGAAAALPGNTEQPAPAEAEPSCQRRKRGQSKHKRRRCVAAATVESAAVAMDNPPQDATQPIGTPVVADTQPPAAPVAETAVAEAVPQPPAEPVPADGASPAAGQDGSATPSENADQPVLGEAEPSSHPRKRARSKHRRRRHATEQ